jgi:hypothetical protein
MAMLVSATLKESNMQLLPRLDAYS